MLRDVPERLKSEELCLLAFKQNGGALEYVPPKLRGKIKGIIPQGKPCTAAVASLIQARRLVRLA